MMDGNEVLRVLALARTDEVVVTTMSTAREWPRFSRREALDVPLLGCMGKASSLGLGIALARPERRVLVLDGDGSLLMNLGSLATVAGLAPGNFVHFVFENGTYDTTGGQPIPAAGVVDFAGLALEAGYRAAYEFDDLDELQAALPTILGEEGPILVDVKVEPGWSHSPFPRRGTAQALAELSAYFGF
ncbi:MAG: thiamine pyrophosphate-binding protein [Chloroflexi bacterium]|nr:thiamine pyrophosphate-binding protein [Chloroflexota bacterium]